MAAATTISFVILDDLRDMVPTVTSEIDGSNASIRAFVESCLPKIDKCTNMAAIVQTDMNMIVTELMTQKYSVYNRVEKYYVIAFAINWTRFEVFSKDCDKELIKWRAEDQNDPVVYQITDTTYNESPVIKLMHALSEASKK